ncbi:hypothetical protein QTP86_025058 [Hemibagrus guttatus]|nr:hypothetical protein QTP86_025058 [Hemibagrus guttatus]
MEEYEARSAASILASVKEQEARFEQLTRALEEERRHVSLQLERANMPRNDHLPWQQVVMQVTRVMERGMQAPPITSPIHWLYQSSHPPIHCLYQSSHPPILTSTNPLPLPILTSTNPLPLPILTSTNPLPLPILTSTNPLPLPILTSTNPLPLPILTSTNPLPLPILTSTNPLPLPILASTNPLPLPILASTNPLPLPILTSTNPLPLPILTSTNPLPLPILTSTNPLPLPILTSTNPLPLPILTSTNPLPLPILTSTNPLPLPILTSTNPHIHQFSASTNPHIHQSTASTNPHIHQSSHPPILTSTNPLPLPILTSTNPLPLPILTSTNSHIHQSTASTNPHIHQSSHPTILCLYQSSHPPIHCLYQSSHPPIHCLYQSSHPPILTSNNPLPLPILTSTNPLPLPILTSTSLLPLPILTSTNPHIHQSSHPPIHCLYQSSHPPIHCLYQSSHLPVYCLYQSSHPPILCLYQSSHPPILTSTNPLPLPILTSHHTLPLSIHRLHQSSASIILERRGDDHFKLTNHHSRKAPLAQEQSPSNQTSLAMMQEPQEVVEETVTIEEDPGTPTSHVSVVTSEDGTTRRTETKVTKMVKTVTTRTVRQVPLGPDGLPVADGSSPLGSYTDSIDRRFMKNGERFVTPQATSTLTRSYNHSNYGDSYYGPHDAYGDVCDNYGSLSRGLNYRPYRPYGYRMENSYTLPIRRDDYGHMAQPQVPVGGSSTVDLNRSQPERFQPEPYGLEDDRRSLGPDDEEPYELEPDYSTASRRTLPSAARAIRDPLRNGPRVRGYDDPIESELIDERHRYAPGVYPAPLAQPERGSTASLDGGIDAGLLRQDPRCWRDPDLPEVIAMLGHPLDPVKANAAAYLQHLCYENDPVKKAVRQLNGIPALVALLEHPKGEVQRKACGALRNLSFGKDNENKVAIRSCDGIPALVRLLRKSGDAEVRELVTGTLWNLSSYEPLKMVIINHALQTMTNEVIIPHSGWEAEPNEDSKPRDAQWTTVFKNTSGCLRNVSSDGAEARRRLRECDGLVDALLHALLSAVGKKDMDNKSVENCVCIMRNLSYHVHKEVPGAEKYQDPSSLQAPGSTGTHRKKKDDAGCFGGKKAKGRRNGDNDKNYDTMDLPKRTEPTKGFELLYQPEVVRLYLSLLTESQNYNTLEAAAGALQNLSAGQWTWSNYIRATVRKEKGLPILVELLRSDSDKVVRAIAIALRNLSIDRRNKDLIGSYAMRDLVSNLPSGQQRPAKNLEEDTVVAVLNTIHEIVTDSSENARSLIMAQAIDKLVAIHRTSQSARETKAASHILQTVWSYKELRNTLTKDGWNKTHFQPTAAVAPKGSKSSKSGYDDSTLPLMEKNQDGYSTIDQRDKDCKYKTSDASSDLTEREPLKGSMCFSESVCCSGDGLCDDGQVFVCFGPVLLQAARLRCRHRICQTWKRGHAGGPRRPDHVPAGDTPTFITTS